ncbi:MAG: hypothetical protein ACOC38_11370, partial [Promethearchaeia archaeon]
ALVSAVLYSSRTGSDTNSRRGNAESWGIEGRAELMESRASTLTSRSWSSARSPWSAYGKKRMMESRKRSGL